MRLQAFFSILLIVFALPMILFSKQDPFRDYWYKGKAELTRYALKQARYGEIHEGEAVLIFVTEPFLKDKQVKLERGSSSQAISVLKLNATRRFFTGIYPYTLITSTFTPVQYEQNRTLKVSATVQEWCGHTYMQLNYRKNRYDAILHSYFQDEGDQGREVNPQWLEDELWNRIRLAPHTLPAGEIRILPGLHFLRLQHIPIQEQTAIASRTDRGSQIIFTLDYKTLKRKLEITFEKEFPHGILSWKETGPGGFAPNASLLTTQATKTNTVLLDYWNHNSVKDAPLRQKLGLTQR